MGPINLGNPTEFTIAELAEQVIELTNSPSRIVHGSLPQDDPKQRQPNISRAQQTLDWTPRTSLKDGLIRTIDYFENLLEDENIRAALSNSSTEAKRSKPSKPTQPRT